MKILFNLIKIKITNKKFQELFNGIMQHHGLQNQIFVPSNNMDLFIIYENKINSKATHAQLLNITIRYKICSVVKTFTNLYYTCTKL